MENKENLEQESEDFEQLDQQENQEQISEDISTEIDEVESKVEEIIIPTVTIISWSTSKSVLEENIMIEHGNFLIKWWSIIWFHSKSELPSIDWKAWSIWKKVLRRDPDWDKDISIWNIEVASAEIERNKRWKIVIQLTGKIFDNDGDDSDEEWVFRRELECTLTNVKWWYEGVIQVRDKDSEELQEYLEWLSEEEIEERTQATLFFKEAELHLWDKIYDNEAFIEWVSSHKPISFRRFINKHRWTNYPVLKKVAELTPKHKLITNKLDRKKFSWKALILAIAMSSTITNYKDNIIEILRGSEVLTNTAPVLNINETTSRIPVSLNLENFSLDSSIHKGVFQINNGDSLGASIKKYIEDNNIEGTIINFWPYINSLESSQSKAYPDDIYQIHLNKTDEWTWKIIKLEK